MSLTPACILTPKAEPLLSLAQAHKNIAFTKARLLLAYMMRSVGYDRMKEIPEIQTNRLLMRAITLKDVEDVFVYSRNPNVLRYTTGKTPSKLAETQEFVRKLITKPKGAFAWAVLLKNNPLVIGVIEFGTSDGLSGGIHYALAEEHWNQGLMTEGVQAVLNWVFRNILDLQNITTSAVSVNKGSIRVMEKCGLRFQKYVKEKWEKYDEPVELAIYSISRDMWSSQQSAAPQKPRYFKS